MQNKKATLIIIFFSVLLIVIIGIYGVLHLLRKDNSVQISDGAKPPLTLDVLNNGKKIGEAIGIVSSWKNNHNFVTASLAPANEILKKEKFLEHAKAGDMVQFVTDNFDKTLFDSIYDITYNVMDSEGNIILPIDEMIDFSEKNIYVPILRENMEKDLYYYVFFNIQDKGTIVYYFKVKANA